ncbi:MAG TPA: metalloregulator ArsR/SmtB family transcription factor [Saprospiraceae bacterium]|nr:metalloregulator ArsR/SmtB family transcription factor [Saprospiraceae bacterium]
MKTDLFQALADPTRRTILLLLASQAMTPNAVAEHFHFSRQAVSKHIRILADSQLLKQEKQGREIYYELNPKKLTEFDHWLEQLRQRWECRFDQLDQIIHQIKSEKK